MLIVGRFPGALAHRGLFSVPFCYLRLSYIITMLKPQQQSLPGLLSVLSTLCVFLLINSFFRAVLGSLQISHIPSVPTHAPPPRLLTSTPQGYVTYN